MSAETWVILAITVVFGGWWLWLVHLSRPALTPQPVRKHTPDPLRERSPDLYARLIGEYSRSAPGSTVPA